MKRYLAIIMLVIVTIISISGGIAAKEDSKPNIAVLPFKGWESRYNKKLADKLIIQLINSNRFNVIDRSLLNKILEEQEFQATGLVNQDTAVKLGKIAGVNKLITGNLTKTIIKSNANKYQVDLQAVVKIIDVKTGKYFDAFEVAGKATKSTQEAAIINALNKAANKIYLRFEDKFIIKAKVTTKQGKEVIIDKGQSDGVKPGMKFSVLKQVNGRTKRITTMSITSVKKNLAYGQLKKSNQQINTTCFVQEIKSKNNLLIDKNNKKENIHISRKDLREVMISGGKKQGVKLHEFYKVVTDLNRSKEKGIVYITEVKTEYSKAKIIKGTFAIEEGMKLKLVPFDNQEISLRSFFSYLEVSTVETANDEEKDRWSHDIFPFYISCKNYNLKNNLYYQGNVGFVKEPTKSKFVDAIGGYQFPLIPDLFYTYIGGGVQCVRTVHQWKDKQVIYNRFSLIAQTGIELKLFEHGGLFIGLDHRNLLTDVLAGEIDQEQQEVYNFSSNAPMFSYGVSFEF